MHELRKVTISDDASDTIFDFPVVFRGTLAEISRYAQHMLELKLVSDKTVFGYHYQNDDGEAWIVT